MKKAASLNQQQDGLGARARAGADIKPAPKPKQQRQKTTITQSHLIPFALGGIEAFSCGDELRVSVRHLCEAFGIDSRTQRRKMANNPRWTWGHMTSHDTAGRPQEMVTLPLEQVPAFLNSINSNKVKPEVRQALLTYQDECTKALFSYWTTGKAEQQTAAAQMAFQVADTLAVFKAEYANMYGKVAGADPDPRMYGQIQAVLNKAVFGVSKLPDLPRKDLPKTALERLKAAAHILRKTFYRGESLKVAAAQVRAAFPEPVLVIEINVELAA
ncbi:phage antirepressor N-terminal domain-containing protein [Deefgea salmonis]|uniref:Phage antirepressor N-terminal domain-containing protein n=1 Tax=Deefgea salmonis TaxID=2875502 RepID=A0ABS8BIF7_9NEIS|nr:phage antirepressor N-terminal domain-containing protein [Deefgea salmonis]MCB5195513.1 phage antirepressor N-terminal domain-containing protein [Deefgea salmonis]